MKQLIFSFFLLAALAACASPQFRFLNEAPDAAAKDALSQMTDREICYNYQEYKDYSQEYALAKTRVEKEYKHRKLNDARCSPAYNVCLSYGIDEKSEDFKNCLVETNNTLLLQRELEKNRLYHMDGYQRCRNSNWGCW